MSQIICRILSGQKGRYRPWDVGPRSSTDLTPSTPSVTQFGSSEKCTFVFICPKLTPNSSRSGGSARQQMFMESPILTIRISGRPKGCQPAHLPFHAILFWVPCKRCTPSTHPCSLHTVSVSAVAIYSQVSAWTRLECTVLIIIRWVELKLLCASMRRLSPVCSGPIGSFLRFLVLEKYIPCHAFRSNWTCHDAHMSSARKWSAKVRSAIKSVSP